MKSPCLAGAFFVSLGMGYWDGKCFFCLYWSTLALIVGLSAKPIYNDIKKAKHEKVISNSASNNSTDSTRSNN